MLPFDLESFIQQTCIETTCQKITKFCGYKDEQRSVSSRSLGGRLLISQQTSSWLTVISFMLP